VSDAMSGTVVRPSVRREIPLDVSAVGRSTLRDSVRAILAELGCYSTEEPEFWARAFRRDRRRPAREGTLVVGDLFHIARRYEARSPHEWTSAVRTSRPFFLAFVRTRRDEAYAWIVDDLVRRSDLRITVCRGGPSSREARECLAEAISALEPDSLLDVRVSPDRDRVRVEFVDGTAGELEWERLGVDEARRGGLVLESATVGGRGKTVELLTHDGDLFEIDAASIRALLDAGFSETLRHLAARSDSSVGTRLRAARREAGVTQTALAERIGVDQAVISRLERGVHRPRLDTLARVAEGLNLSVPQLLSA